MNDDPERLEIRTHDGRGLGARLHEPRGRRVLGTAIFAHAMFQNKSAFERPRGQGLARLFYEAGWRTLTFDFRGHGESTCDGAARAADERPWGYDDLVRVDLPAVVDAARSRWSRSRLVLVGHALGAHAALAAQGCGLIAADALVLAAPDVWMRRLEPSRRVWLLKAATLLAMAALARRHTSLPSRALLLGTDDEPARFVDDLARFALRGRWTSGDGLLDYDAGLARIDAPTFAITSDGARLHGRAEPAARMLAPLRRCTHHRVTGDDHGGPAPGHVELMTSVTHRVAWRRALGWLAETR